MRYVHPLKGGVLVIVVINSTVTVSYGHLYPCAVRCCSSNCAAEHVPMGAGLGARSPSGGPGPRRQVGSRHEVLPLVLHSVHRALESTNSVET